MNGLHQDLGLTFLFIATFLITNVKLFFYICCSKKQTFEHTEVNQRGTQVLPLNDSPRTFYCLEVGEKSKVIYNKYSKGINYG